MSGHIPNGQTDKGRDTIIDMKGLRTGVPVSKRLVISIISIIMLFVLISFIPLDQYGEKTSLALAFLVSMVAMIIFLPVNIALDGIIVALFGAALGFWDWSTIGATFGSSSFLTIFGMLIVSMGCEFTPFGARLAYFVLKRFGQKPKRMVFVLAIVSACLSAFVSNVAVIIMMSSICAEMLNAMKQQPGSSKLGRTLMLTIPMAAIVGGMALINGSPTGNTMAIQFMTNAAGGAYTVSYGQWAVCGIACFVVMIIPMCVVYIGCFKLKNSDVEVLPKKYYAKLLADLGPIGGSEIRWIITVIAMVACMLSGVKTGVAALLFAAISVFPGIGTVPADKAIKKLPIGPMMAAGTMPLLSNLFSATGLGDCMSDWITPLVIDSGPVGLSILSALLVGVMVNLFVNANLAVSALVIGIVTPVCIKLGYNPVIIMMPTMFLASFFFAMGSHNIMLLNYGYGYWSMKDPIIPGFLVVLLCAVAFPVICYFVGPIFGINIFI